MNNIQSLSISLVIRRLLENESLRISEFENFETYFQICSKLNNDQLEQLTNLIQNQNERDFVFALETIFCCSDINFYLLKQLFSDFFLQVSKKSIKNYNQNFERQFFFEKQFFFHQIMTQSEKVLSISLNQNNIKLISLGTNVDKILNKAKRNAIKSLNFLLKYILSIKSIYEIQLSDYEKKILADYIQMFSEYLKFFLTQTHTVVAAKFSENVSLSVEVCICSMKLLSLSS